MPKTNFSNEQLCLRDKLAYDRTLMASERTWLAYLRTTIGLLAAGGTALILLGENSLFQALGVVSIILGALIIIMGTVRFLQSRKRLKKLYQNL